MLRCRGRRPSDRRKVVGQGMVGRGKCMAVGLERCTEMMYVGSPRDPAVAGDAGDTRTG